MLSLRPFRNPSPGLSDLLNPAAVIDDGVVLNKDGSLTAGWYYKGNDTASATDDEQNNCSARVNAALARLGTGWSSHHDAIRVPSLAYPAPGASAFPDPITNLIDAERRAQFEAEGAHFESRYALTVTYLPPLRQKSRVADMMFEEQKGQKKTTLAERTLTFFKGALAELEDALRSELTIERMVARRYTDEFGRSHENDELLQFLNFCVTGDDHPVNLPPVPMYIDSIIGGREFRSGLTPKIGDKFILPIALDGFPQESYPGILSILDQLPMPYRWSTRFVYLDAYQAKGEIEKYQKKWQQKTRGFFSQVFRTGGGNIDQDALAMAQDANDAMAEAASNHVTFGYYTSIVILMHEDHDILEDAARVVRREIQNLGFGCRFETVNAVEAWLGTIPGHVKPNLRRVLVHTLNLADMLPLSSVWAGEAVCPCPFYPPASPPLFHASTSGATPFRMNFHVGDLGHTVIFGPPGSGKSTAMAFSIAQFFRYRDAKVFAFDKGRSVYALAHAAGGQHYDIAGDDSPLAFAPLSRIDDERERAWAEEWVANLIELSGMPMNPERRSTIHQALKVLADAPSDSRSITDLRTGIQDKAMREALDAYTIDGSIGKLLDHKEDNLELGRFNAFEMEELLNMGERAVLPVLSYLFHRIERALDGSPAMISLDEAWVMLGHKIFREKIREWLKVLRKANCLVLLGTQNLSDAQASGILDVIMEACPTKIFLPNESAMQHGGGSVLGPYELYSTFGLNQRQIEIIATAVPKRHYYVVTANGRRLIELGLGPVALSFVAVSSKKDVARVRALIAEHGADWPYRWMEIRHANFAPYLTTEPQPELVTQ